MDKPLTMKQEIYVQGLILGKSQREAYKEAYPNSRKWPDKTVDSKASTLLSTGKVSERFEALKDEFKNRNMVTVERILQEYSRLGFFDPRKLFNDDGNPKKITELDDDIAAAVAGLDVVEFFEGCGEDRGMTGYIKKYKLANKIGALDSMARHLNMFVDKQEVKITYELTEPDDLEEQR